MRNKQNRLAARLQFIDLIDAAVLKIHVADRESFINQKDFRIDIDGHSKGKPNVHSSGIGFNWTVNEVPDFGES